MGLFLQGMTAWSCVVFDGSVGVVCNYFSHCAERRQAIFSAHGQNEYEGYKRLLTVGSGVSYVQFWDVVNI